ncbi:YtxH domain-containing protein [Gordonia sp. CPCC 205333]|uniref:YtxH domain-containing protein n=1 Tax=Gordonia sp. CPCC 205333 TaxID=3140790 RepID=UPI003AF3F6D8
MTTTSGGLSKPGASTYRARVLDTRAVISRASVACVVPALAVAAHGIAGGELPQSAGLVIVAGIGVVAGLLIRGAGLLGVAGVLTGAQAACHAALSISHGHLMTADLTAASGAASMLLTHLVAIPLSAVTIVALAHLISLITSVLRVIDAYATPAPRDTYSGYAAPSALTGCRIDVRHPVRGPPISAGAPLLII